VNHELKRDYLKTAVHANLKGRALKNYRGKKGAGSVEKKKLLLLTKIKSCQR